MKLGGNVLILGATSAIGECVAHELAQCGCTLALAGRDHAMLKRIASDVNIRHQVDTHVLDFDAGDIDAFDAFLKHAREQLNGEIDGIVLTYGVLFDQEHLRHDEQQLREMLVVNYVSPVLLLNRLTDELMNREDAARRKKSWFCVVTSVAGDRGRFSNYFYGSTKAGLDTYLQGMRSEMHAAGVSVLTVKPGPVDTPMTWGMSKLPLLATAPTVAGSIVRAIRRRRNIIYTPWPWRIIMTILCSIPEWLFKRVKV